MKRKHESTSDTPSKKVEQDRVTEAVRRFRDGMDSSVTLAHLRDFHAETKVKEVAEEERKKVFDEFMPLVMEFRGEKLGELVAELDAGLQKVTNDMMKVNQEHKEKTEAFFGQIMDFLCEDYKMTVEAQILSNPDLGLDLDMLKNFLKNEKNVAVKFFSDQCNQWNPGAVQEQSAKLEERLSGLQKDFEEFHKPNGSGGVLVASTSTPPVLETSHTQMEQESLTISTPPSGVAVAKEKSSTSSCPASAEEKKAFEQLERLILHKCKRLGTYYEVYRSEYRRKDLEDDIKQVERLLQDHNQFSCEEYLQIHAKLMQIVKIAKKALFTAGDFSGAKKLSPGGNAVRVNSEHASLWARAFDLDLRECFTSERESKEFKINKRGLQWTLLKKFVTEKCDEYQTKSSEWKRPRRGSGRQEGLDALLKSQERSLELEVKKIVLKISDLFTKRLYLTWKLRGVSALESDSEEEGDSGSSDSEEENPPPASQDVAAIKEEVMSDSDKEN